MTDDTAISEPGPPSDTSSRAFMRFDHSRWVSWINKFLIGEACDPPVTVGHQEPYMTLGAVYEGLESKTQRDMFAAAVTVLFESTPIINQNARYFRSLIELLALLKPYQAKGLLRRHLFARSFVGMEDGMLNLHTLLLIANSKYEIDEELVDFIERTACETNSFGYLLTCLTAISQSGGGKYLELLSTVLPRVKKERTAALLAREIGDILFLHGSRHFCDWYSATARSAVRGNTFFDSFELLEGALKKLVFRHSEIHAPDANRTIVAAQLHAYDQRYDAKEVLAIARLHRHIGRDTTVNALINIWRRIKGLFQEEGLPWYYISPPPRSHGRFPSLISSGPNPNTSISATFWEEQEPILAEIFEAVKDECYRVPEMAWRKAG